MDWLNLLRFESGISAALWMLLFTAGILYVLSRTIKSGFRHMENALKETGQALEQLLVRVIEEQRAAHGIPARGRPLRQESLPEAWSRTEPVVAEETVKRLRQWLLDHPDEARVWRIANPSGFRLWVELLGVDVVRRIWPEDFPGEDMAASGPPRS